MKLSRSFTIALNFLLDQLIPPLLRDSRFFLPPIFRALFGSDAETLLEFKRLAPSMTDAQYADAYRQIAKHNVRRETDLNKACIQRLSMKVRNVTVLDAGCGTGFLSNILSKSAEVTAADILISDATKNRYPGVKFVEAFVEKLPFTDKQFDTVVCTHTLEHVRDVPRAMSELRRVASRRLIIVVPQQRPFLYTFDLHLQFFPYPHSLELALAKGAPKIRSCEVVGGDLVYEENFDGE